MLHQDESLLIFNKSAGLATQGGNNIRHSLDSIAAHAFKSQTGEPPRWETPACMPVDELMDQMEPRVPHLSRSDSECT